MGWDHPRVTLGKGVPESLDSFIENFYRLHGLKLGRSKAILVLLDRNKKYQELLRKISDNP